MKKIFTLVLLGLALTACAPAPCDCPDAASKKCACKEKASAAPSMDDDCPMCDEARKQQEAAAKKAKAKK